MLISICNLQTKMTSQKNYYSKKKKSTEVDERTAELCSKQGNTDITELVVIDEMPQFKICKEHSTKGPTFCACGSILQELPAQKTETLNKTTRHVMIHLNSLHLRRRRTSGHAGSLNPESQDFQTAQRHFRSSTTWSGIRGFSHV